MALDSAKSSIKVLHASSCSQPSHTKYSYKPSAFQLAPPSSPSLIASQLAYRLVGIFGGVNDVGRLHTLALPLSNYADDNFSPRLAGTI